MSDCFVGFNDSYICVHKHKGQLGFGISTIIHMVQEWQSYILISKVHVVEDA